tara:strand:+ start:117 stop:713 length:597 start_codon:yes stop_codon:yes gene_type:complete
VGFLKKGKRMPTYDDYNRLVNSKWPDHIPIPEPDEAVAFAKAVYRKAMGRPWKGKTKVVSGNRHTWVRNGVLNVNPNTRGLSSAGFQNILHNISHFAHRRLHPNDRPHSDSQLYLERNLTDWVLKKGFLNGSLKTSPKPKIDLVEKRARRVEAAICRAETKLKKLASDKRRTEKRLSELRAKKRYYDRKQTVKILTNN